MLPDLACSHDQAADKIEGLSVNRLCSYFFHNNIILTYQNFIYNRRKRWAVEVMQIQLKKEKLQQLVILSEINLYCVNLQFDMIEKYIFYADDKSLLKQCESELYPVMCDAIEKAPVIYERSNGDLVGIIKVHEDSFYLTSIVSGERMVKLLAFLEIVDLMLMNRITYQKDILIKANVEYNEQKHKVQDIIEADMMQEVYHSFNDEQEFIQAIEQGDKNKVFEFLERGFVQTFRRTSKDSVIHYRNVCITGITLASRAAIRGGVPASMAYEFADTLTRQVYKIVSISELYTLICGVFNRYTQMVIDEKMNDVSNSLVEQCRQYVLSHYKNKITVCEIADYLGRNPNYVSTVFKEKTGVTLKSYINHEKIEAAKDMLKYSDYNVLTISDFLSFNSQAYFGKIFKEITGTTPKRYRDEKSGKRAGMGKCY